MDKLSSSITTERHQRAKYGRGIAKLQKLSSKPIAPSSPPDATAAVTAQAGYDQEEEEEEDEAEGKGMNFEPMQIMATEQRKLSATGPTVQAHLIRWKGYDTTESMTWQSASEFDRFDLPKWERPSNPNTPKSGRICRVWARWLGGKEGTWYLVEWHGLENIDDLTWEKAKKVHRPAIAAYIKVIPGQEDASTMGKMGDLAAETGEDANGNHATSRDEEDPQEEQDEDSSHAKEGPKFSQTNYNQDEVEEAKDHEDEKASDDRNGQKASQPAISQEVDATENTEKADDRQDVRAEEDVEEIEQEQGSSQSNSNHSEEEHSEPTPLASSGSSHRQAVPTSLAPINISPAKRHDADDKDILGSYAASLYQDLYAEHAKSTKVGETKAVASDAEEAEEAEGEARKTLGTREGPITGSLPTMNDFSNQNVDNPNVSVTKGANLAKADSPAAVTARGYQAVGDTSIEVALSGAKVTPADTVNDNVAQVDLNAARAQNGAADTPEAVVDKTTKRQRSTRKQQPIQPGSKRQRQR
ncbi:hypothetical protein IFR05_012445 [Cadophora sp. M221]|nr:hypothetical protein IFR05_012445 [Cadophora sp. M221]